MNLFFLFIFFSLTLANANEELLEQNLSLQGLEKFKESEEARKGFLGRSFLPSISSGLGYERFQTGFYRSFTQPYGFIEAKVNLFNSGRDALTSRIYNLEYRIAESNLSIERREVLAKIRKLTWEITFNSELIKLLELEQAQNSKIKNQAAIRSRSGIATRTDSLEFSIYDSEIREGIESLLHENEILKTALLPLVGLKIKSELTFNKSLEHEHDELLLKNSYDSGRNPLVQKLKSQSESSDLQRQIINRWWAPSVDVYGGYYHYTLRERDYLNQEDRDDTAIGIRLTFELFDGLQGSTASSRERYLTEGRKLLAQYEKNSIESKYIMLQEDLNYTHEVMHYIEDRIKLSKEYLRMTLNEYDRGVKNSLDALTAMQRYFRYEKQYLEKKKEYQIVKADLLAIVGE